MNNFTRFIPALIFVPLVALGAANHLAGLDANSGGPAPKAGQPGDPRKVTRTISVTMSDDMRFQPITLTVKVGETVRFVVKNLGKVHHEMVIGTAADLKEHVEMMRKMPEMDHTTGKHLSLEPGQQGAIIWRFGEPGIIDFACLVPGHYEAGMIGKIVVK
ncbi:cupredoxin family protein [Ralstonia pickettii]|jgi:uncharacterized cupredoxin-like copper-binding protein|uniref:Blue (Type 1) copper domain protein n=1 Tax=Ralstonia pickettii (strain 12J) TaxID=402626 RepID=B2UF37_RALPJ|nr:MULTISPECIES: cupredoxin family protein [Ralstonia]MCP4210327.1 cupredoxin family protein [Halieaceae bacterium]NOZ15635.1 cupredoxin family protein [Betaproteobacteria bacterium]MBA9878611.1 copper-binding protein [Ralstonia pickettii]MBA9885177.1 copper-binding protein [Ralstonia pickettii]MBA9888617.1 copper-binding protein [Ralstonia pickettii]